MLLNFHFFISFQIKIQLMKTLIKIFLILIKISKRIAETLGHDNHLNDKLKNRIIT